MSDAMQEDKTATSLADTEGNNEPQSKSDTTTPPADKAEEGTERAETAGAC